MVMNVVKNMVEVKEIQIPEELYDKIKIFIESRPDLGYLNVDDFVQDALRHLIFED